MSKFWQKLKSKKVILAMVIGFFIVVGIWAAYASMNKVLPQSSIHFLNDINAPKAGDKILVFSPHPDDESIGVGGYIYNAEKAGATVRIVLATDGNKQGLKDKRYTEFRHATSVLGVDQSNLIFLGHPDGALSAVGENTLTREFQKAVDDFQPDVVFYPYVNDEHPDHAFTGVVAQKVTKGAKITSFQYLVHANYYPQPQRYLPDDYLLPPEKLVTFDKEWERYMLSDETEMKLKEAFECYNSQMKNPLIKILFLSSIRKNELFITTNGE